MGIEVNCLCHYEKLAFEVKALLESKEIILRGALKLRAPFNELGEVYEKNGDLVFSFRGEEYRLELGKECEKWLSKILAPPKSLSQKLGLKPETKIFKADIFQSNEFNSAVSNNLNVDINNAQIIFKQIEYKNELIDFIKRYFENKISSSVWILNKKGKNSLFNENQIRDIMRENGFKDNKTCSIDEIWSATRYNHEKN